MTSLTVLPLDELRRLVEEAVAETLRRELPPALEYANEKPYLTNKEVADLTGLSIRRLADLRSQKRIEYRKRGRTILYRTRDVYRWIEEGLVTRSNSRGRA